MSVLHVSSTCVRLNNTRIWKKKTVLYLTFLSTKSDTRWSIRKMVKKKIKKKILIQVILTCFFKKPKKPLKLQSPLDTPTYGQKCGIIAVKGYLTSKDNRLLSRTRCTICCKCCSLMRFSHSRLIMPPYTLLNIFKSGLINSWMKSNTFHAIHLMWCSGAKIVK